MAVADVYQFGIDGVLDLQSVADFLSCSKRTIERRCEDEEFESKIEGGRRVVCRRSLMAYLDTLPN